MLTEQVECGKCLGGRNESSSPAQRSRATLHGGASRGSGSSRTGRVLVAYMATEGLLERRNTVNSVIEVASGTHAAHKKFVKEPWDLRQMAGWGQIQPEAAMRPQTQQLHGGRACGFQTVGFGVACRSTLSELCRHMSGPIN